MAPWHSVAASCTMANVWAIMMFLMIILSHDYPVGALRHGVGRAHLHRLGEEQDKNLRLPALAYLQHTGGFSKEQVDQWSDDFPPLATLDTARHVAPKLRFLTHTMLRSVADEEERRALIAECVPPQYFGARLEKVIAPRHAFLASRRDLPSFRDLFRLGGSVGEARGPLSPHKSLFVTFLSVRSDIAFADLCNAWIAEHNLEGAMKGGRTAKAIDAAGEIRVIVEGEKPAAAAAGSAAVDAGLVHCFCAAFQRGLLCAVRNELQDGSGVSAGCMVRLLLEHGADLGGGGGGGGGREAPRPLLPYEPLPWRALAATARCADLGAAPLAVTNDSPAAVNEGADRVDLRVASSGRRRRLQEEEEEEEREEGSEDVLGFSLLHGGASALHWACGGGNLEGAQELIAYAIASATAAKREKKKTTTTTKSMRSALSLAAIGATLDGLRDKQGATVLHWAAAGAEAHNFGVGGHEQMVRFLVEELGMDANAVTVPMHQHQQQRRHGYDDENKGNDAAVEAGKEGLALAEAQSSAPGAKGNTVLMWGAWGGNLEVVRLLVERCAVDVSARNDRGCTVAHWAAGGGSAAVCRFLLEEAGVSFTAKNRMGSTPLSKAVAHGRADVLDFITEEGDGDLKTKREQREHALALANELCDVTGQDPARERIRRSLLKDQHGDGSP